MWSYHPKPRPLRVCCLARCALVAAVTLLPAVIGIHLDTLALLTSAQAASTSATQPSVSGPVKMPAAPPLPVPSRAAVEQATAMAEQTQLAATLISPHIVDASAQELAEQINGLLPHKTNIEVRVQNPARFTFDLQNKPAGQVLRAVARLSGCQFYILGDHWLLATEPQLSEDERAEIKEWNYRALDSNSAAYQATAQASAVLTEFLAATLTAPTGVQAATLAQADDAVEEEPLKSRSLHWDDLSPDLQQLLQQLVTWEERPLGGARPRFTPLQLTATTTIQLDYDAKYARLEIKTDPALANPVRYRWEAGQSPQSRQRMQRMMEQARANNGIGTFNPGGPSLVTTPAAH